MAEVTPEKPDGALVITGIGTTKGWFAHSKTRRIDPKGFVGTLPAPLLWKHEQPLGEVFSIRATDLAVYFQALVVPPGTPGYDSNLLSRVWADIRSGDVRALSVWVPSWPNKDGQWSLAELSVVPKGGNPFATIVRANFPDGHVVKRPAMGFTEADSITAWRGRVAQLATPTTEKPTSEVRVVRDASGAMIGVEKIGADGKTVTHAVDNASPGIQTLVNEAVQRALDTLHAVQPDGTLVSARDVARDAARAPVTDGWPPAVYRGTWKAETEYSRGSMVTLNGTLRHAEFDRVTDRPGTSPGWKLMHKTMEKPSR